MIKEGVFLGKRYEILGRIGSGGMADVYKGKDHKLNRFVAIKVLKSTYRSDETFIKKFLSEAQAAAGLMHPNVVNVYDVGQDRGLYYMVMELVEGITLKDYIEKKGKLSAKETISISIQMVTGIQAAHNCHIIHRDIKPQNIIISKDGKVKVTDFGIARATTSTATQAVTTTVMGSVHYTSPEQARGGIVDEKSDIYSAGITMYEMITGHVPFDGDSTVTVALKHLNEVIKSPAEEVPDIPYSLECIIMKCTQKLPNKRYMSCEELLQDLKHSLVDPDGDFVKIASAGGDSDTVIMTDKDLDDIRNGYDDDDEYDDEYDTADVYSGKGYNDREDGDDEYDDYTSGRDSDEVNPHMHKIMKILTVVVIAIIVLILVFTVGKAAGVFKSFGGITTEDEADASGKVTVPDIRGLTEEQAKSVLNKKHLGIKIVKRTESKAGLISKQTPEAGEKVKKNTTIEVVVSSGQVKSKKQVPDVRGMGETEAQKELEDAGFKVTSSFQYDDSVASGNVISTTPSAGTKAEKGSTVTMLVSQGTDKKTVPDVRGMADATAQSTIKNYGFNVGTVTYDYSDSVEKGMVISQTVTPGGKAAAGTTISITVSNGPKPEEKIDIQSFVGQQESALKSWASQNGLYTNVSDSQYSSSYAKGCIISMSPSSGNISKGGTISMW